MIKMPRILPILTLLEKTYRNKAKLNIGETLIGKRYETAPLLINLCSHKLGAPLTYTAFT